MKSALYMGNKTMEVRESTPQEPKPDEVMVKIAWCGICGTDLHIFNGAMDARVPIPHIAGHECSGTVAKIGENVSGIAVGDAVVVRPLGPCGECYACKKGLSHICYNLNFLGVDSNGAFQEYWTVPADIIHKLPSGMDLAYGALIEPLAVACHDVRLGSVQKGDKVLVVGGGPIGILIAMVVRNRGAEVLVSEISDFRLKLAESMGFGIVNPIESSLKDTVMKWTDNIGADVAFEVTSTSPGIAGIPELMRVRGQIVVVGIFSHQPPIDLHKFFLREIKMRGARVYEAEDYEMAIKLAASGELPLEDIVTAKYSLDRIQRAFELLTSDNKQMKILIECK